MNVLIPAVSSATTPDGVSRHAVNLAACLLHELSIERIDLAIGRWQQASIASLLPSPNPRLRIHVPLTGSSSTARNLWYFRQLPHLAHELRSDIIHATYPVPLQASSLPCPVVVTLHDLYPYDVPANFGYPRVFLNRLILHQSLTAADAIACVSECTLERVAALRPDVKHKTVFIPNCIPPLLASEPVQSFPVQSLIEKPFLLAVAQHRKNKDIPRTLAIFERLLTTRPDLLLVLIGNRGPESSEIDHLLDRRQLRSRVRLLHGINEQQLQWCYRQAELLLATSTHEGFGLAVAEAMLAGCPVVCSDIPAFRELGADYCRFVPTALTDSTQRFTEAVRSVLCSTRPRPAALPHLSASAIALQYLRLYGSFSARRLQPITSLFQLNKQKGGAA